MNAGININDCKELRALHKPPEDVKKIAGAILALLGVIGTIDVRNERDPRMWKFFRTKLTQTTGNDDLISRMSRFSSKEVTKEQIAMAKRMMAGITLQGISNVSMASCSLYLWVNRAIESVDN